MTKKLGAGDSFPKMTLKLLDGGSFTVPDDINSKYMVLLFYRGHW